MSAGTDREKSLERQIRAFHWVRLALLAAISFRSELRGGDLLLSRCLRDPASQNGVGRAGARHGRRRVVLSAHVDTTRAGWLFSPRWADFFARLARRRAVDFGAAVARVALRGEADPIAIA